MCWFAWLDRFPISRLKGISNGFGIKERFSFGMDGVHRFLRVNQTHSFSTSGWSSCRYDSAFIIATKRLDSSLHRGNVEFSLSMSSACSIASMTFLVFICDSKTIARSKFSQYFHSISFLVVAVSMHLSRYSRASDRVFASPIWKRASEE